jgi:nitric oxide reductase NorE protein
MSLTMTAAASADDQVTAREPLPLPAGESGLLTPPGGLLVWLFSTIEMVTFGAMFVVFMVKRAAAPAEFAAAQATLDPTYALVNTVVLVTSGYLVAQGVALHRAGKDRLAAWWFLGGAGLGAVFLAVKGTEYAGKLAAGQGLDAGTFYSFYWMLTGFHFLHVAIGVLVLLATSRFLARGGVARDADFGVETGATFWHLCDVIWICLFPLLYILS